MEPASGDGSVVLLRLADLDVNRYAPALPIDPAAVADVIRAVTAHGWEQPAASVVLTPQRTHAVIAGRTRLRAAAALDHDVVPCTLHDFAQWEADLQAWHAMNVRVARLAEPIDPAALAALHDAARDRYGDDPTATLHQLHQALPERGTP